ncbi:MAG: hypothetical protein ACREJD_14580 [Phycisphaerales bacterium]
MLTRFAIFRSFLVLLLAVWNPLCLCNTHGAEAASPALSACGAACTCCEDSKAPDGCDSADSDSGHKSDHARHDCACPNLIATSAPASEVAAKNVSVMAVVPLFEMPRPEPFEPQVGVEVRSRLVLPKPATSLLRQHCALIV